MLFKIKQQLFANEPNGAPQLYWGTFLRVCLSPLNSNIHPCVWGWIFNPCSHYSKISHRIDWTLRMTWA